MGVSAPATTPVITPVITIDGPGGSGKGTISQRLAKKLGWRFLDSGALYRLLAVAASKRGIQLDDEPALKRLARDMNVKFVHGGGGTGGRVLLEGADVTDAIRQERVGNDASRLAALQGVRDALLARQHAFRIPPGLVADGRDMGTVVFPDAALKIFLTASPEERARRRHKQLKGKGMSVTLPPLLAEIDERDRRDRERAASPLRPAEDAVVIDTTGHGIEAVMNRVMALVDERGLCTE